ncbi:MAG: hypothetical protein V3R73_00610, partial [Sphingomonadales bacterium]
GANSYLSAIVGDGIIILILAFSLAIMADVLAQAYATQTQAGLQYQSRAPSRPHRHDRPRRERPRPDRPSGRRPARGKRSPLPKPRSSAPPSGPIDIGPQGRGPEKPPSSWSGQGKYGGRKYSSGKKGK